MELKDMTAAQAAELISEEIKEYSRISTENRLPYDRDRLICDEPLVRFADGDDPLFTAYKTIIAPSHLTPREALSQSYGKSPAELPGRLSVISWILPVAAATRKSNRAEKKIPARLWSHTRWYGEAFNEALRRHVAGFLKGSGIMATAPMLEPYWMRLEDPRSGEYSNYSERHVAFAAGQGTFGLSDGFISERGIAHRCGSVVAAIELPASGRSASGPYANCLFYTERGCDACIRRCPAGAITAKGHDKKKCAHYMRTVIGDVCRQYDVRVAGCGLCQTGVPCEAKNPTAKAGGRADD